MIFKNLSLIFLTLFSTKSFSIDCDSFEWKKVTKEEGVYKFSVSQRCDLGYHPKITLEDVNQVTIKQKKKFADEIFTEDISKPNYLFSSRERLSLKHGDLRLHSKNFGFTDVYTSEFRSESKVLRATDNAKYVESTIDIVVGEKTYNDDLFVEIGTTVYMNKPPLVPIKMLKKKIKKNLEEDLSSKSAKLHRAILRQA